ncbi:MAG: CsgG/HfaB family protein [Acidobacteriaceae bacterium]
MRHLFRAALILALASWLTPSSQTANAQAPSAKPKIAVLDFNYGTVMTSVQAMFGTNQDIGKGITDLLVNRLVNDGTYRVIERSDLDKVLNEQNFSTSDRADAATAAKIGKVLGVNAIITGDITQFGRDDQYRNYGALAGNWGGGILGHFGHNKAKAVVAITARIIDVNTAEVLASVTGTGESTRSGTSLLGNGYNGAGYAGGSASMGSSNFAQTILGEAVNKAVTDLATGLEAKAGSLSSATTAPPVKGLVADASTSDIIIDVGSAAGVHVGEKLVVKRVLRTIMDPATGKPLRTISSPVGQLTITSTDANSSVGRFTGAGAPRVGDTVESISTQ